MSLRDIEIGTIYGALDSVALADGEPLDANILRTLSLSANRLLARGHPLLQLLWNTGGSGGDDTEEGGWVGWAPPVWLKIVPGPLTLPKKPGLTRARAYARFLSQSGSSCLLQVATDAAPFNAAHTAANINTLNLDGANAYTTTALGDIPISHTAFEHLSLYMFGYVTTVNGSTATNGSPNTGIIDGVREHDIIQHNAATWNTGPQNWARNGHAIIIETATGIELTAPRWISQVKTGTELRVRPSLGDDLLARSFEGATFRIREMPRIRFASIGLYALDRIQ